MTTDDHHQHHSQGRGGQGNMTLVRGPSPTPADLATPTIKQPHFTTGRGGTGNIVTGDATTARTAQDVEDAPREPPTKGTYHWGRGGEGNRVTLERGGDEKGEGERGTRDKANISGDKATGQRKGSFRGTLEKAREAVTGKWSHKGPKESTGAVE